MTEQQRKRIDQMSQREMAKLWRFAPVGEPLLQGDAGKHFAEVFARKGGMTPAISKSIGLSR